MAVDQLRAGSIIIDIPPVIQPYIHEIEAERDRLLKEDAEPRPVDMTDEQFAEYKRGAALFRAFDIVLRKHTQED